MNVLIIVDKEGTAIDRLAKSVQRTLKHHKIVVFAVHPKRPDIDTLIDLEKLLKWCDVLDVHYWKSGIVVREHYKELFESKPRILFHFNPYDAESDENKVYDKVVVGNREIYNRVPYAHLVPYGIDLSFFKFNPEYTQEKTVMMSVNRIEGKKGVAEVAQACKELGYKFLLVGRISKPDYFNALQVNAGEDMEFYEGVSDEKLREIYYRSAIHVCNSIDAFESGTLPILEAMACGVPVLTRPVGHVPDLYNGSNMILRTGVTEDVGDLKAQLKNLMESSELRDSIRQKAWDTVRNRDDRRMSYDIQKLYYNLFKPTTPLVSVIIPTRDHPESFADCLIAAIRQDFPKFEIVIADSGDDPVKPIVNRIREQTDVPIKYIHFPHKSNYTLAEARNRAVIEADGQVLVFCDDRLEMKSDAVQQFAAFSRSNCWLWGQKDGVLKGFVENFSAVQRKDLIKHGMFNERIQWYGGMTQDIRSRFEDDNHLEFISIPEAQANSLKRATSKNRRREDIIEAKMINYKLYLK